MATYYVDAVLGSDGNLGTSPGAGNAWASLTPAVAAPVTAGDTVYIKASASYTLTATVTFTISGSAASGPIIYEGYTTTPGARDGRPTITSATSGVALLSLSAATMLRFVHLQLTHTHATTRGPGFKAIGAAVSPLITIDDCLVDGCSIGVDGTTRAIGAFLSGTTIQNCTSHGVQNDSSGFAFAEGCKFLNNTGDGWRWGAAGSANSLFKSTLFAGNGGRGFYDPTTTRTSIFMFENCTIANNTSSGIQFDASSGTITLALAGSIIYGNGGYGVTIPSLTLNANAARLVANRYNAYGSNTSGNLNLVPSGFGEITLTASPFTNSAGGDYSLNTTAGGGAACRATGYPAYADVGALQHLDAGGGSSVSIPPSPITSRGWDYIG